MADCIEQSSGVDVEQAAIALFGTAPRGTSWAGASPQIKDRFRAKARTSLAALSAAQFSNLRASA